jgi:inosose dehydratase
VDVPSIVGSLSANGCSGWYVLEQDTILTEEPRGQGPVADVWASADHLRSVLRGVRR